MHVSFAGAGLLAERADMSPYPLQERAGQKGFGLFANQDLKEGQFVIEYIGEVRLPPPSTRDGQDDLPALSVAWQLLRQLHYHCMGLQFSAGSSGQLEVIGWLGPLLLLISRRTAPELLGSQVCRHT